MDGYPQPGIVFKDITPLLGDGPALRAVVAALAAGHGPVDKIAGIEARGFILAASVACQLGSGFVPVRKQGKLPAPTYAQTYELEYAAIPLAYPPGTKFEYSNLGYLTLGILIHRVTGEFYGDFLKQRIFAPLGMTTTRIISEADIIPNRAAGYRLVNGELKNQEWVAPSLEFLGRRKPVFFHSRSGQMGRRPQHRKIAQTFKLAADVDSCQAQHRPAQSGQLRIRLVH